MLVLCTLTERAVPQRHFSFRRALLSRTNLFVKHLKGTGLISSHQSGRNTIHVARDQVQLSRERCQKVSKGPQSLRSPNYLLCPHAQTVRAREPRMFPDPHSPRYAPRRVALHPRWQSEVLPT